MNRAEKEELIKTWKAEREASKATAVQPIEAPKPVKTFEVDGEQIPYETPKPQTANPLGNAWAEIARRKADLD